METDKTELEKLGEKEPEKLNLSRQAKLVPKQKIDEWTVKIFGVGSIGSHLTKTLAKTGFEHIEVYDMDTVEEENIAAQAFDFKHVGKNKVDAMFDIIKDACGLEIKTFHGEITEKTVIEPEPNTVYCVCFDSFEARRLVWGKVKDFPVLFIDGRIGQYNLRHYLTNTSVKKWVDEYDASLNTGAESELVCGEKACAPINAMLGGMITMNLVAFISGEDYVRKFIGNALTPKNNIVVIGGGVK